MIRGTTAQFKFEIPYAKSELYWATMSFWQPGNNNLSTIIKNLSHCEGSDDSHELYVSLTVPETLQFSEKYKGKVQFRAQCIDGTVFGSRPKLFTVYPMQDEVVEEYPELPAVQNHWVVFDGGKVSE